MDQLAILGLDLTSFYRHCFAKGSRGAPYIITHETDNRGNDAKRGIHLLFPIGKRPTSSEIQTILAPSKSVSISFKPSILEEGDCQAVPSWLELLCDGLTFELSNLSDGKVAPSLVHGQLDGFDRIYLAPGHHLTGGEGTLPVLRAMMALTASFGDLLPDLCGFYWPPAGSQSTKASFTSAIDRWLSGGTFPVPELIGLNRPDGNAMQSQGLSFITGQELQLDNALSAEPDSAARLAARMLSQLVLQGRIETADRVIGPDGNPLNLGLSSDTNIVVVTRG